MRFTLRATFLLTCWQFVLVCDAPRVSADDEAQLEKWRRTYEQEILPIVRERCQDCHNGDEADGGFDVSQFSSGEQVAKKMDLWDEVGKRVRLREMPPEGSPQLNDAQKAAFHRWLDSRPQQDLCSQLATDETQAWYRGYVMSRRLTRTEYLNAIRDLVGVPIDPQLELPSDGSGGEGFDTNGDTLFTSPIHIEQYLAVASQTIEAALPVSDAADGEQVIDGEQVVAFDRTRERILGPAPGAEVSERDAASGAVAHFARRAWRRPVSPEEISQLMTLYEAARERGAGHDEAVREPLKAILVSPHFLFVVESEAPEGGVQRLTPHQLATRLALLVWSSIPDEVLLQEADAGRLDTDAQVIAQLRRMLSDPKARALGENFGMQWLALSHFLHSVRPDAELFPDFNESLASDLREEAVRLVSSIFMEDRSLLELIDADYVYVNGQLASHYGLPLPADAPWQRVETSSRRRGGVVTLGAVLMSSSYPRRTSPVLRGRWVIEEVLGGRVPPPPADIPALEHTEPEREMTLRERLELHRKSPECSSCHQRMDPLGFGLENFDVLGRWRESDQGMAIDSSGKLPSGETFEGPEQLKEILMKRADEFKKHFVRKLLGFALGRELNKFDQCVVDKSLERLAENDHRASVVLETIVTSYPFQHRYFKAAVVDSSTAAK